MTTQKMGNVGIEIRAHADGPESWEIELTLYRPMTTGIWSRVNQGYSTPTPEPNDEVDDVILAMAKERIVLPDDARLYLVDTAPLVTYGDGTPFDPDVLSARLVFEVGR